MPVIAAATSERMSMRRMENGKALWRVKSKMVPVVIAVLGAVTTKLKEWLHEIQGTTCGFRDVKA